MAKGGNKNYVSFWFWFLAPLVWIIPCIGFPMMFVWAFTGDNESRKNHYKAMLAWWGILALFYMVIFSIGIWPSVSKQLDAGWARLLKMLGAG